MRHSPTPAEQELWNAVVTGVRAADQPDPAGFETAVGRLFQLPRPWVRQVLEDTVGLLVEELDPDGRDTWPLLAVRVGRWERWSPRVDRALLAALLPGAARPPAVDALGEPENTRHLLLLISCLADAAQVGVGEFLDVVLAANSTRAPRRRPGSVPRCRLGR